MQFLKMAQKVRQLVGMQGTGPSSVSATGYEGLLVALVSDAWEDLQNYRKKWKWMRASKDFLLTVGITTYTPATIFAPNHRFKSWLTEEPFYALVNGQKQPIKYFEYSYFNYRHLNDTTNTVVSEYTVRPNDYALVFNLPDSAYTIYSCYKKNNQELVASTDEPEMPEDYHMYLVYEATARYALSMSMGAVYQLYANKAKELLGSILREQNAKEVLQLQSIV